MNNLQKQKPKNLIRYGDIFRINNHLLACGDARDKELVDEVIGKMRINLICCDVPYGVRAVESKEGFSELRVNKRILNDDIMSEFSYIKFTNDWLTPVIPHLTAKNAVYIFNSDNMIFALREGMEQSGIKFEYIK